MFLRFKWKVTWTSPSFRNTNWAEEHEHAFEHCNFSSMYNTEDHALYEFYNLAVGTLTNKSQSSPYLTKYTVRVISLLTTKDE